MNYSRLAFLILGILFLAQSGFMIFVEVMANSALSTMASMPLALAIMSLCLSYLYPQFKQKDERMKLIRQKGTLASFFAMMFYLFVFNIGIYGDFFVLSASELIQILTVLMISTLFISFVVYSKIY